MRLVLLLSVACAAPSPEATRAELRALCLDACEVQAEGAGCQPYAAWCRESCDTYEGLLPEACMGVAEVAFTCWAAEEWRCDGPPPFAMPEPEEDGACAQETEALYECG